VVRQLFGLSGVGLILLFSATAIAPAQESAAPRPTDSQANASQLLDGFGQYTAHRYARARDILEPLAHQGKADAQQLVGSMYANGEGVPRDPVRAAHWFFRATE
jgi:uncharacterized protein